MRWSAAFLLLAACTIKREVPQDRFACESGGPCYDGSIPFDPDAASDNRDAGTDAEPKDIGPSDNGVPLDVGPIAECLGIQPVPMTGRASASSFLATDVYAGSCVRYPGGRDVVFGFQVPGRLTFLRVSTKSSDYDTVLHMYREDCSPLSEIGCNDETRYFEIAPDRTSYLQYFDFPPGLYAIVIDGFNDQSFGMYALEVFGEIAPGEPCDPAQPFLACEVGTCADDGTGYRCPPLMDCGDGIDADRDGMIDEDDTACLNPPTALCPSVGQPYIYRNLELTGSASDETEVIQRRWTIETHPPGSSWREAGGWNDVTYYMVPDLVGRYVHRFRAVDDMLQATACEVTYDPLLFEFLEVELTWNEAENVNDNWADLGLHFLHPDAVGWFDVNLDCYANTCFPTRPWGPGGAEDDPYLIPYLYGPDVFSITTPENRTYRVGVHYEWTPVTKTATATVKIFCNGNFEAEYSALLRKGEDLPENNDFWKVADIQYQGGGCNTVRLTDGNGNPLIVPANTTYMGR